MRRRAALLALLLGSPAWGAPASFDYVDYRGDDGGPAPGPGEYRNPILAGYYPDPAITQRGGDYYIVNSSFAHFPGLPVWHSRDLVSWTQIGNAIDRPGQVDFKQLGLSRGLFAPDIAYHDGIWLIANTCVDCGGNFVITAKKPEGPWSDPVWNDIDGIDPAFFFDADGSAWMLNNGAPEGKPRYEGHRAIWIQRFDMKTLKPYGPRKVVIDGGARPEDKPIWIEGPRIFRKDGWYYLSAAEGGTAEGHSQVIFRSRQVDGLYQPGPNNPILTQRDLDPARPSPVTSAGHAGYVTTPDGRWWASFLATRPYKGDFYNIGRETFLLPVEWRDGWPVILPPKASIPLVHPRPNLPRRPAPRVPTSGPMHLREEFISAKLDPAWIGIRNPRGDWRRIEKGALVLTPKADQLGGSGNPAYVARRLQHHNASIETRLRFAPELGERAGLAVHQDTAAFYALSATRTAKGLAVQLQRRAAKTEPEGGVVVASAPVTGDDVRLRITAKADRYDFAYALGQAGWRTLAADQDGTILSTKSAGGFVGATVGPFAARD